MLILAALAFAVAGTAAPPAANAGDVVSEVVATQIGGAFKEPMLATSAPGHPNVIFVVEKSGQVKVIKNGVEQAQPFLDMRGRVGLLHNEQGLFSIAFDPGYRRNGLVYAYYAGRNCNAETWGCELELAEFQRSRKDPLSARFASRRIVLRIPHQQSGSHNGGTITFGPDGKLWLATGDGGGGGGGDFDDQARDKSSLLGKLLRINPRPRPAKGDRPARGYSVPADNPFVGIPGRNEIWSIGLRNPFRFSFDPGSATLAIGDVGQGTMEEISMTTIDAARGANFGWPEWEGTFHHDPGRPGSGPLIDPVYSYGRGEGIAVMAGVFMRDPRFAGTSFDPDNDRFLFADGFLGSLRTIHGDTDPETPIDHVPTPLSILGPAGFSADRAGRIYVAGRLAGRVYRLDPQP